MTTFCTVCKHPWYTVEKKLKIHFLFLDAWVICSVHFWELLTAQKTNKRRILLEQFVTELHRKTAVICDVMYVYFGAEPVDYVSIVPKDGKSPWR